MPILFLEASPEVTNLQELFTMFTTWMASIVTTITSHPILMLGLSVFCVGAVIGLAYRLIRG